MAWELWTSDGTANGTKLVKDINLGDKDSNPRSFINLNGTLYFIASNYLSDHGKAFEKIWKSDGTEKGTIPINSP